MMNDDRVRDALEKIEYHQDDMHNRTTAIELWAADEISHKEAFDQMVERWKKAEGLIMDLENVLRSLGEVRDAEATKKKTR